MFSLGPVIPVLRIFDEYKAKEFYVGLLGCSVVFEHRYGANFPLYFGVSRSNWALHLSEHHGDATPGAHIRIQCSDLRVFFAELSAKDYKYAKPGEPSATPWQTLEATIVDPFGNRLTFVQSSTVHGEG